MVKAGLYATPGGQVCYDYVIPQIPASGSVNNAAQTLGNETRPGVALKLAQVKIHNFRSVLCQEITLQGYSLLVGPNNAGKSSIIDAIRAFYESDGAKFKEEDVPRIPAADQESWVELLFHLDADEADSLAEDYQSPENVLRVRRHFRAADGSAKPGPIHAYTKEGELANKPFCTSTQLRNGELGKLIYIPAISDVSDHAKLSGPSALRSLVSDILGSVVGSGQAYSRLSENVREFSEKVRTESTQDNRSLDGLEAEMNKLLEPWQTKFSFNISAPSPEDIIKQMIGLELVDELNGQPQPVDNFGSGFQRHFIYSLIRLSSGYSLAKPRKTSDDFRLSLTLMLFEEPETFLHPPQQEELARSLMKLAAQDDWQIACATHSPHFVSKNFRDIPAVIRVSRQADGATAYQISEAEWEAIADSNQAINRIAQAHPKMKNLLADDDLKPEMEAVKLSLWLNPDRSSIFFADQVLLVEGATEVALINRLIGDEKIPAGTNGLYVLDCLGKYNIHRFMNLLGHLGIPHSVLYDSDDGNEQHKAINHLIETSGNNFTLRVQPVAGDIEKFLGIPPTKASHRKPQHALYYYETGQIDTAKLEEFCALLKACLRRDC